MTDKELLDAKVSFVQKTELMFTDISSEEYRQYEFSKGQMVLIPNPLYLAVTESGHRVYDASGVSHYIPKGWIHLSWKARLGMPKFVK